jgi:phosphoribosylformimino-5-aminoimidazole carboxamide ribotide isomerase
VNIPVIASGGVHTIKDVEALCEVQDEGIEGVICGRSIYEGTLNLQEAQNRADELSGEFDDMEAID